MVLLKATVLHLFRIFSFQMLFFNRQPRTRIILFWQKGNSLARMITALQFPYFGLMELDNLLNVLINRSSQYYRTRNGKKRTFGHVRPAKIQISLCIRAVWSESSLGPFWIAKHARFHHVEHEDSDQTARMRRLIWGFVGHTCQRYVFARYGQVICTLVACIISSHQSNFD